MDNRIQELTEKIFREGVEKGSRKADEIVNEAQAKSSAIIADARAEADRIIANAKKKAEEMQKTMESELKLSSQQALSSLKQKIIDCVTAKALSDNITKTLSDPETVKDFVKTALQNWNPSQKASVELLLPADKQHQLEKAFKAGIFDSLAKGLEITWSKAFKAGFQVRPKDGSFKISLTDEDFSEFFKEFLRPRAKAFLFGE
jgi:V/A-type H+-transporting ATPase subunit E